MSPIRQKVLEGCLHNQGQAAVKKHRVSKIASSVGWRAVQTNKMYFVVL